MFHKQNALAKQILHTGIKMTKKKTVQSILRQRYCKHLKSEPYDDIAYDIIEIRTCMII